jgi:hypothetical protein
LLNPAAVRASAPTCWRSRIWAVGGAVAELPLATETYDSGIKAQAGQPEMIEDRMNNMK